MSRIVIALGGNALGDTPSQQKENAIKTAKSLANVIALGHEVIITHGNGPQVGLINLAFIEGNKVNEKVYDMPFAECGAMSEGYIGYHLQNALLNELSKKGINKNVISVVTQVEVNPNDEAFANPSKPIGSFYSKEEASKLPYTMKEDAGRGYRRVIASPKPVRIIELDAIKTLISNGNIVISVGGGGIPVINEDNQYKGVDAVIDKDFASAKLASELNADMLIILTAVKEVCLNFNKENEVKLNKVTTSELIRYNQEGHFLKGSMKPKVEATLEFVKGDKEALITSLDSLLEAMNGNCGTRIIEG